MDIPIISAVIKFGVTLATFNKRMDNQSKKIKEQELEMRELKENYLDRFESVHKRINVSERTILDRMNENHIDIIDRINARQ